MTSSSEGNMPGCGSKSGCKSGPEPCSPSSSSSATVSASKYGATYCSGTFHGGTRVAKSTHTSQLSLANSPSSTWTAAFKVASSGDSCGCVLTTLTLPQSCWNSGGDGRLASST